MKKKSFLFGLLGLLTLIPLGAHAEDVQMPQWGKQVITVQSGQTVTFYDYKGCYKEGSTINGFSADAYATTIFKPAKDGEKVKIVFEKVLMTTDDYEDDTYASLKIYKGVFDTTSVSYTKYSLTGFPKNSNMLEDLTGGTFTNKTYMSADATGALSVCYHAYTTDWDKQGWKATVTTVSSSPMEVKSAAADYTNTRSELFVGEQNVYMGGIRIITEGLGNPDYLTSISFTLSGNVFDATQLRLYQTDKTSVAGLTPVEGAIAKNGNTYTFTCNQPLDAGINNFCLAGDMLSRATIGAASTLTITGLTTKNGFKTLATATAKEQTVTEVRMVNASHLTIYVSGDMPFYDDGGVDGKISQGFEGTVTFLPVHAGKKVQLDMHDIHIFYTKSAAGFGRADILSIYNGTSTNKDSLLYTLEVDGGKVDNYTAKSTADNGALTVYLKSNCQITSMQGSGFEAVVSEFSAVQMEVVSSVVTKQSGKVAGCAEGVQVMQFCLTTENTEPALQPTLFHFNTGNTYERIDSATLYFTGASAEFAATQKVGKVAVTGNEFTIPASGISLAEGENRFFLTCDIACNVQNGDKVTANILQTDFSNNTEYKDFSNSADALTIGNTLYSDCGSKTVHVYGEWLFTHTPGEWYSDRYDAVTCDQMTTFVPTTEGTVIQMNFSDFAISFNSYSKATFRIYAGQDTKGTLLWEADKDNYTEGPGQIRSTAEDGSLTVLFNANTEYGTYIGAGKGWKATVSEYLPQPMAIETTTLTALSSDALTRGQKNAALLGLNITTAGDLTPLGVKNITVTLSDCAAAVDSLLLLQGENIVARAEVKGTEVVLPVNATLLEGENAYTLAAHIAKDATIGTEVTVKSVQIAVGETTLAPEVPANTCIVRNMYLLKSGNQRVEVDNAPLSFYDDGGAEGKITLGIKGTVTFVPTVANSAVQLKFKQWDINGADNFYIYYGESTKDKADISLLRSTNVGDLTVISSDATGALTITYEANNYYATDGWEIEVSCHALQPLTLDSVKVQDVSATTVNRGSADVKVLRAAVYVSGDRGKMPVENFSVETTLGAEAVKVYGTGTLDAFGTTNLLAKADTITNRGTYYYWITLDVPAATEEGAAVTATLKSVDVNKTTVQPKNTATASFEVIGGMHGTYLVGASDAAKYKTIQSAIDALQNGIESAVTFLIEPGTYTEYLTIPEIEGVSADNTVTFCSQTGNREDVVIKYDNYSPQSSPMGDATQGIVNVNGADYITFSNLTLTTGNESYHAVVLVRNKAEHITIDSCYIYRAENIASTNVRLVYVTAKDEKNNNNYFTLSNSVLRGGYSGVTTSGNWTVKQIGARIIGNTFEGQGAQSINVSMGETNAVVDDNIVRKTVESDKSTWCIDLRLSEGAQISNNYVYINLASTVSHGLYIRDINGTEEAPEHIYNNVVDMTNAASDNSYAVYFNKSGNNIIFANNTVRTSGANAYPLYIQRSSTNLQVVNNLLYAKDLPAAWLPSAKYVSKFEHNLLYSESGSFGKIGAAEYKDIAEWRKTVGSTTDITETVTFESADLLRPAEKGNLVSAEPLDFVTTDITGRDRAVVPTIGAYEWFDKTGTGCQNAEANGVYVFPTVTCDLLYVHGAADAEVRILNLQGQPVLRTALAADQETLDVSALPQGAYLLEINGNVFRFIKQ